MLRGDTHGAEFPIETLSKTARVDALADALRMGLEHDDFMPALL